MSTRGAAALALLLASCGEYTTTSPAPDISGSWRYSQVVQGGGTTCGDGGTLTITQNGERLSGSLTGRGGCQSQSVAIDYLRQDALLNGEIARSAVAFEAGACRYQGTAVGNPVTQAGGSATCSNLASTGLVVSGSWELLRP